MVKASLLRNKIWIMVGLFGFAFSGRKLLTCQVNQHNYYCWKADFKSQSAYGWLIITDKGREMFQMLSECLQVLCSIFNNYFLLWMSIGMKDDLSGCFLCCMKEEMIKADDKSSSSWFCVSLPSSSFQLWNYACFPDAQCCKYLLGILDSHFSQVLGIQQKLK